MAREAGLTPAPRPSETGIATCYKPPTGLWPAAAAAISSYGETAMDLAAAFAPQLQPVFARDPDRCMTDPAVPTLAVAVNAYGRGGVTGWLMGQMEDLNRLAGVREKSDARALEQAAGAILAGYPGLRLTDVMLFLMRFKAGHYGRFYGTTDPLVLTTALPAYCEERAKALRRIEAERQHGERLMSRLETYGAVEMTIDELRASSLWQTMTDGLRRWFEAVATARDHPDGTWERYRFHLLRCRKTHEVVLDGRFHAEDVKLIGAEARGERNGL